MCTVTVFQSWPEEDFFCFVQEIEMSLQYLKKREKITVSFKHTTQ